MCAADMGYIDAQDLRFRSILWNTLFELATSLNA